MRTPGVRSLTFVCALTVAVSLVVRVAADAQLGGIISRGRTAAEDEINRKVDTLVRNAVRCVVGDAECVRKARASGGTPVMTSADGTILTDAKGMPITDPDVAARQVAAAGGSPAGAAAGSTERPGTGAWANYDFVPGDRVLFAEDFTGDQVGDFPRRLELKRGNWEVVEWQGRRLLRNVGPRGAAVEVPLPETLPDRFTIEVDVYFGHSNHEIILVTTTLNGPVSTLGANYINIGRTGTGVAASSRGGLESRAQDKRLSTTLTPVRIMVDGPYAKVYVNERRVANIPNAQLPRGQVLRIENTYAASEAAPVLLGSIRVAAGGGRLYDTLARDGRVATQGIYFATGSATLRPESTATLQEIGEMLRAHAALRLTIEGHTDSDGDDAMNLDLSARRAMAVKEHLVSTFGIDAGRLETLGLGETRPAADNATPEGKQQNRRVELVRQGG